MLRLASPGFELPVGFLRERKWVAAAAILAVGVLPSKEISFAAAVLLLIALRPLSGVEVRGVLTRLWPILLMLVIALVMTMVDVADQFDPRAIVRIFFYYIRIPVFLMLGFATRKYVMRSSTLLWMLLLLGMYSAGMTVFTYLTTDGLSGLDRTTLRQIVGGGDPVAVFVPLVGRILWSKRPAVWQKALILVAVAMSLGSIVATDSRTGLVIVAISFMLSLPRVRPLQWVRFAAVAILVGAFIVTTPIMPPILDILGIDPSMLGGFNEVIARPRYDIGVINQEWRGHETYMAFLAAEDDGVIPLIMGHGLSITAALGISIELAPGQFFSAIDIFHNGYSFIVLHSGLIGVLLYWTQMWILARPQAALRPEASAGARISDEDLLFVLVLLSLSASTATIAGMFNASTFAQLHLFLIGCFYPLRRAAVASLPRLAGSPSVSRTLRARPLSQQ